MADPNPMTVIADCIEKSKASTDPELISDYIAEALGVLQTESTEDDAFNMLGSAIIDAVADDPTHTEALLEVWSAAEAAITGQPEMPRRRAVGAQLVRTGHRARTAQRGIVNREGLKVCGLSAGGSRIRTCMGLFLSSGLLACWRFFVRSAKVVLRPVACDPVRGAGGRGQGTETVA